MKDKKFNPEPLLKSKDRDEIISKLLADFDLGDIVEWLKAKYPNDKSAHLSKPYLKRFKDEHLDIYCTLKEDLQKTYANTLTSPEEQLETTLANNTAYQNRLKEYLDNELDLQTILRKAMARVEYRIEQIWEETVNDPRNLKPDRTLIEWMNTLLQLCEKYQPILNGPVSNINIQNNYNITLIDKHIAAIHSVMREVLSQLDYETSMTAMALLSEKLAALKEETVPVLPQEERLEEAKILAMETKENLKNIE